MKIRIKEKPHKNGIKYLIQKRKGLLWKTLDCTFTLEEAKKIANTIKEMDEYNNPKPKYPTISFIGYGVRNNYARTGIASIMNVYESYPTCKRGEYPCKEEDIFWRGGRELLTINLKTLFNDLGLEPHKYRITIEKLD